MAPNSRLGYLALPGNQRYYFRVSLLHPITMPNGIHVPAFSKISSLSPLAHKRSNSSRTSWRSSGHIFPSTWVHADTIPPMVSLMHFVPSRPIIALMPPYHRRLAYCAMAMLLVMVLDLMESGGDGMQDPVFPCQSTHLRLVVLPFPLEARNTHVEAIANANVPHGKSHVSSPVDTLPVTLSCPATSLSP